LRYATNDATSVKERIVDRAMEYSVLVTPSNWRVMVWSKVLKGGIRFGKVTLRKCTALTPEMG
jgi:hypothetical protein